jgi:Zn-finger nucleic acid-binding protein
MICLRCGTVEMEIQLRGEGDDKVEVDQCPTCRALWLDAKELAKLDDNFFVDVEDLELSDVNPSEEDTQLTCPRCEGKPSLRKARPKDHGDVVLDTCPSCKGFWLDAGELEKVKEVSTEALVAALFD